MDSLTKVGIEKALRDLLPGCIVECTLSGDGTASLLVLGKDSGYFAVVGLVRSQYRGETGMRKLARFIYEDLEMARQGLATPRLQRVPPASFRADTSSNLLIERRH